MIQQLEFYKEIMYNGQTEACNNLTVSKKACKRKHSYMKEEDERSMTDAERQAWLQEMNRRGF